MLLQIYILLYKEVALALKINSMYSKRLLLAVHENIKVLRFPNHFAAGVYLWYAISFDFLLFQSYDQFKTYYYHRSHHEKIVIVDHRVCFLGGLDLCFGRYDSQDHRVHDSSSRIWPGKDYYNPR